MSDWTPAGLLAYWSEFEYAAAAAEQERLLALVIVPQPWVTRLAYVLYLCRAHRLGERVDRWQTARAVRIWQERGRA